MSKVCMTVQVEPSTHAAVKDIAKQLPGNTIHAIHRALLAYAAEQVQKDPSLLASRLVRY